MADLPRWKQLGDGSVWPRTGDGPEHGDSLEWVLRYAPERLTRGDQLHLASIVAAYRELLSCTDRRRREVIRGMRPTQQHSEQP
jgi:hypothetical protein